MSRLTGYLALLMGLGLLLSFCWLAAPVRAQQPPTTVDQVIAKYAEAVGAERFSSINTVTERGDLYGNLSNFWQGATTPTQSQKTERGSFEFYFKRPNRRFTSNLTVNHQIIALHGCNGEVSWYINAYLERREFKPKPGADYDCENGFEPSPLHLRDPNVKVRLVKKREVEGHMAWEIRVDDPKSKGPEIYDIDADSYLLVRSEKYGSSVTYSDYRDVGGFKFPFTIIREFTNSKLVSSVREVKINAPIDDSRFIEPEVKGRTVNLNPTGVPPNHEPETSNSAAPTTVPAGSGVPSPKAAAAAPTATEVSFPNFTSCSIAELERMIPELKGLKPASDQQKLTGFLDKVGSTTLRIAQNTPNLISKESVINSQPGVGETHHDYDYLLLRRIDRDRVDLNEFRVDLKTGEKFRTDEAMQDESAESAELERASHELLATQSGAPVSQGFATAWVHFYPLNRPQASFRYLGEQKVEGKHTLVLAFAQKPESVLSPAQVRYRGKTVPMFLQGVAWVDASEYRILHLRTDLLSPIPEVELHRLTVDIQFAPTRIEQVAWLLSLPREVMVTTEASGTTMRERHNYSDYRLFRSRSRVVLNP